ncbi:DUF6056 family protein [Lachnospiraceae bacterium OttesenSCG-928-D06]|nr:DUF6056 family protein [Lachnospiraceae bacterium OttesenSCG-928-D06]
MKKDEIIKKQMKKICTFLFFPVNLKCLAIVGGILFVASLIPILRLSHYSHPAGDDFDYGFFSHAYWTTTHSLTETLKWVLFRIRTSYATWQGTFSSIFLMTFSPYIFAEELYFTTAYIMLGMLITSYLFLIKVILVDLLGVDKASYFVVSLICIFVTIQQIHYPLHGIYWYNGSVHYTFMHACMFFLIGSVILLLQKGSKRKKAVYMIISCVMAVLCGGGNYVTALILGILLPIILLVGYIFSKKKLILPLVPCMVFYLCFFISVVAPGNSVRQNSQSWRDIYFVSETPIQSIYLSFVEAFRMGEEWFSFVLLLCMILIIPVTWKMLTKTDFLFPYPAIVTVLTFCIWAAMFTPLIYTTGNSLIPRALNIIKMMYHFLLFMNLIYWLGWLQKVLLKKGIEFNAQNSVAFYIVLSLLFFASFMTAKSREMSFLSYGAYATLRTGQADVFHYENIERREILRGDENTAILEPFSQRPYLLYYGDLSTDADAFINRMVSNYYGKDYVVIKKQESLDTSNP